MDTSSVSSTNQLPPKYLVFTPLLEALTLLQPLKLTIWAILTVSEKGHFSPSPPATLDQGKSSFLKEPDCEYLYFEAKEATWRILYRHVII